MYDIGTVWVMDAVHVPYGCSVWPALFTRESLRSRDRRTVADVQMVKIGLLEARSTSSRL
jgi:hypothetical protein